MQFAQVGEFESSKSAMNTRAPGVERVDHHLAVDRAGDLDPPVGDLVGRRRDPPVARADLGGLGQEIRQLAGVEPLRAAGRAARAAPATRPERALEVGQERERVGGEDIVSVHAMILASHEWAWGRKALPVAAHAGDPASSNCSSSVEPLSASVELVPPVIVSSTWSK